MSSGRSKGKPARKRPVFRAAKEVRKLARERIGQVPGGKIIQPKSRKGPKHPKKEQENWLEG